MEEDDALGDEQVGELVRLAVTRVQRRACPKRPRPDVRDVVVDSSGERDCGLGHVVDVLVRARAQLVEEAARIAPVDATLSPPKYDSRYSCAASGSISWFSGLSCTPTWRFWAMSWLPPKLLIAWKMTRKSQSSR